MGRLERSGAPTLRKRPQWCLIALCCLVLGIPGTVSAEIAEARILLVLLFDGWAPALVDAFPTPTLDRIRTEGAYTHRFEPAFPSISLINQVTISTGCWPEHHGIVTNRFLDPERGLYDHSPDRDWLIGCEHLHEAAERQGVPSAVLGWVGGRSGANGDLASYVSKETSFDEFPDDPGRAEEVIRLLRKPDGERPRLILAYFQGPDSAAHFTGMESEATRNAVVASDAAVGAILDAIRQLPYRDRVTLFVTTDHGMAPVTTVVNVARILRNHDIDAEAISTGTTAFLYLADPSGIDRAHRLLSAYEEFDVYRTGDHPEDWHLGSGPRVGDLIISSRPPYFIEDIELWPAWARWLGRWGPEFMWAGFSLKATHGYPAGTPGVDGILYAWGSGVSKAREVGTVRAVDLHPTVTRLLGIETGIPTDGTVATSMLDSH
jgi:alkaline phosphatase D